MNAVTQRQFQDVPAVRGPTPLLLGLIGPSGSGKTYSALRLATGMQRITGGEIYLIDTESRRALHYAKHFNFRHVVFKAPFSPMDYLAAIEHCLNKGAKTIIVDSTSHEHEGPGGVLEWHAQEVERIMKAWSCSEEKANIPAWNKPKSARRRLINSVIQMEANFIFCFRAKDKVKIGKGTVTQQGFMPIAGEEFVFELTAKCLLLPGANGVPTWQSQNVGEQMMIKLPEQFKGIFTGAAGKPLDETIGQSLAEWAAGDEDSPIPTVDALLKSYAACTNTPSFEEIERQRGRAWSAASKAEKAQLKSASDDAKKRIDEAASSSTTTATTTTSSEPPQDYDSASAIAAINAAETLDALAATWEAIQSSYDRRGFELGIEIDFAHTTRKEQLEELAL